jgi:hypothetical protein
LPLDHVSLPSPWFQRNKIITGAQERHIAAGAADHGIVAVAAEENIGDQAAGDRVIADAAVGCQQHVACELRGIDAVIAAEAVDDDAVRGFRTADRHLSLQAGDRHGAAEQRQIEMLLPSAIDGIHAAVWRRARPGRSRLV